MEKQSRTFVVLLTFLASLIAVAAEGTEHFRFLGASNDSCANVDCQQGTCVPTDNVLLSILFPYKCKCNSGWATLQQVVPFLEIPSLPCNVPNCSLNLECAGNSPAPAPGSSTPIESANSSACLVPGICGHGTCEITSNSLIPTFKCTCHPGYTNVLNMTAGYCVNQCEINGGCRNLNITLPGLSSPSPPGTPAPPADQTANAGTASPESYNPDVGGHSPNEPSESVPGSSSPSSSPGCRGKSLNGGIYYSAAALVMGWSFLTRLC